MTNQCKADLRRKDDEKKTIWHLCARQRLHAGDHECYCGQVWHRQAEELCQTWRANTTTRYAEAKPNTFRVTGDMVLDMYGKRRIDLNKREEEGRRESGEAI